MSVPELPLEIPWQLAATTQPLGPENLALQPDTTTISLFTYTPHIKILENDYPNDQLIYLKFTVSVSPFFFRFIPTFPGFEFLGVFSSDALPIWRLLFDVRISPKPYAEGVTKPYFLSASPIRRTMMETGVVGQQVSEGESKALAIGKSGSQMREGFSSLVDTNTSSVDWPVPIGNISTSDSSTSVSGSRTVVQNVDTTQREASTERQELVSHMTNVNNILSLLSAFNIGTPYLRFSLWSRPLRPLTIDTADPNLWYAELLRRRSSGIEGMQDFYAIAVVPRNEGFCIKATLKRLSYITFPLPVPELEMPVFSSWEPTEEQIAILEDYLNRRYPKGTPVDDELDVEPYKGNPPSPTNRPVVVDWDIGTYSNAFATFRILDLPEGNDYRFPTMSNFIYKSAIEVWLDMKKNEYEQELIKSPLEEGIPFFIDLSLNTCFNAPPILTVTEKSSILDKPKVVRTTKTKAPQTTSSAGERKFSLYQRAVFAWNAAENRLGNVFSHAKELPVSELRFDHPKMVDIALCKFARLAPDDELNHTLNDVGGWFGLTNDRIVSLRRRGITDVREMAEALTLASVIDRTNQRRKAIIISPGSNRRRQPKGKRNTRKVIPQRLKTPPPIPQVFTREEADKIRRAFGDTLQANYAPG